MVLEIRCVEPIYPQYSGVLDTGLALRYWFFEVHGSESVKHANIIFPSVAFLYSLSIVYLTVTYTPYGSYRAMHYF